MDAAPGMLNRVHTANRPFQYFFKCYELQSTLMRQLWGQKIDDDGRAGSFLYTATHLFNLFHALNLINGMTQRLVSNHLANAGKTRGKKSSHPLADGCWKLM